MVLYGKCARHRMSLNETLPKSMTSSPVFCVLMSFFTTRHFHLVHFFSLQLVLL